MVVIIIIIIIINSFIDGGDGQQSDFILKDVRCWDVLFILQQLLIPKAHFPAVLTILEVASLWE